MRLPRGLITREKGGQEKKRASTFKLDRKKKKERGRSIGGGFRNLAQTENGLRSRRKDKKGKTNPDLWFFLVKSGK